MLNKSQTRNSTKTDQGAVRGFAVPFIWALTVAAALQLALPVTVDAAEGASASDAKCFACHAMKFNKTLANGQTLALHVPAEEFAQSVHGKFGCAICHQDIGGREHPYPAIEITNTRDYAVEKNTVCRNCHQAKFKQYEGSIHARLVADGNTAAPLCTDCHSAHAIKAVATYEPLTGQPCKTCHENIFDAYAQSVHGTARANGNVIRASHIQAPLCADCHQAHEITAVAASARLQSTCLACHDGARQAHEVWLPNAGLHLDVVACAACHSPLAERRIDLQLFDKATLAPLADPRGRDATENSVGETDAAGNGLNPAELWSLVRESSQNGEAIEVTLHGRMEVSTGVDAHRLAIKASAVRDCQSCHQYGADTYQNVTVSFVRADGRKQRYQVDSTVLNSMESIDSVRNFYTMGGTRIRSLDHLLILSLLVGLAIPLGHMTIGKYLRKKRYEGEEI